MIGTNEHAYPDLSVSLELLFVEASDLIVFQVLELVLIIISSFLFILTLLSKSQTIVKEVSRSYREAIKTEDDLRGFTFDAAVGRTTGCNYEWAGWMKVKACRVTCMRCNFHYRFHSNVSAVNHKRSTHSH